MIHSKYYRIVFVSGIVMLLAAGVRAERALTPEDLLNEVDTSALEQAIADNLPPELELPDAEDWQSFWNQVETILQSQSLGDMTWFRPTVQQACAYLDADPATQPWADWLRQRLDYFEMASVAVREVPSKPAVPLTSLIPTPPIQTPAIQETAPAAITSPVVTQAVRKVPPLVLPGPQPAREPVSLQVESKRHSLIRSSSRWQKKLAKRPVPPNAAALIPRLKKVFQSEGLPPELVWVAEVESSLNPAARSPVGALGLFQLMPATARRFGLRTGFFDERKNPEKSAHAAARYLKFLYRALGSWPLALAAYNAGEGRVSRLMKLKRQSSFEGIANDLPLETQMYVPKVMALVSLRENIDPDKMPGLTPATSLLSVLSILTPPSAPGNVCPERPGLRQERSRGSSTLHECQYFHDIGGRSSATPLVLAWMTQPCRNDAHTQFMLAFRK
ncbi:MAG: lytic transglycosylase domain-containing protein [Kiritimatiellae bacterium]|nr:lytic transglycosylase domain-containing protein [Kiritimatiellia bacterium]